MPVENWRQQGSYVSPIEEALPDPAAGTLVCLPPINPALLKYIAGCLDQLRNPSAYEGLSDADIALSLQRADTLRGMLGRPIACTDVSYEVRLNACVLEQSTDGGATWTAVAGWDGFAACIPGMVSTAISVPSNPLGLSTDQQACNIAGYVANQIIQGVVSALQNAISEGRSAIQFATDLTLGAFIFRTVFPISTAALLGIDALLSLGASIGASELLTIAADVTLWQEITCAIYQAIRATGRITASNWPTAISNIRALSYAVPGVTGGIADWLQSTDISTVYEWQQLAPIDSVDCSSCGWCYTWGGPGRAMNTDWGPRMCGAGGAAEAELVAGVWRNVIETSGGSSNHLLAVILALPAGTQVKDLTISYDDSGGGDITDRYAETNATLCNADGTVYALDFGAGSHHSIIHINAVCTRIEISVRTRLDGSPTDYSHITGITLSGTGTAPLGTPNC